MNIDKLELTKLMQSASTKAASIWKKFIDNGKNKHDSSKTIIKSTKEDFKLLQV